MKLNVLIVMLMAGMLGGCHYGKPEPEAVHIVLCWLKQPGDAQDRQKLIDTSRSFLGQIPGLIRVQPGPCLATARPGADATYDVGLVFTFKNEASLRAYDTNPIHQAAVRDILQPRASKVVIYDFRDDTPLLKK